MPGTNKFNWNLYGRYLNSLTGIHLLNVRVLLHTVPLKNSKFYNVFKEMNHFRFGKVALKMHDQIDVGLVKQKRLKTLKNLTNPKCLKGSVGLDIS